MKSTRPIFLLVFALVSTALFAENPGPLDRRLIGPREFLKFTVEDCDAGTNALVRGIVTHVSVLRDNVFLLAPADGPARQAMVVLSNDALASPVPGDVVQVEGAADWNMNHPELIAGRVELIRSAPAPRARGVKQADFRHGILDGRLAALTGVVTEIHNSSTETGPVLSIGIRIDNYTAIVKAPGAVDAAAYLGRKVTARGAVFNRYGRNGDFLDAELELSSLADLEFHDGEAIPVYLVVAAAVTGTVLVAAIGTLLFLWRKSRRERRVMEVIAAERRRMAADLHDTIEQHLAGANLLAAGVLALDDVPADVAEAMKSLSDLLANAKAEVRSAVTNLRATGEDRPLVELIAEAARGLAKTGVKVRKLLRGIPETIPAAATQDIILIAREATTNAVKHGKAKTIVFTGDPLPDGGFRLRVLNDGAPFKIENALGPETGHYGLSGMKERALRNRCAIAWGTHGRWTYVQLDVPDFKGEKK